MALITIPQIMGQQANGTLSYCFINEPLKVYIPTTSQATGTGAYSVGNSTITGSGTLFTTELSIGSSIIVEGLEYEIATITSDTSATITTTFTVASLYAVIIIGSRNTNEIYADVTQISTSTGSSESTRVKYIVRDITPLGGIVIDLMKVVKQLHDFDVYHNSTVSNITSGWDSVVSKYIYKFEFYTNTSDAKTTVLKLPILGGRTFQNFVPAVDYNTPIQEIAHDDLLLSDLLGHFIPKFTLREIASVTGSDYSPIRSSVLVNVGDAPCEGVIYWKSKLGGWQCWGMNLKTTKINGSYSGNIDNGMFESSNFTGAGNAYIPVNYTSVNSSTSITLKCLSLTAEELIGVAEINGSPAVYYQKNATSSLELMRLTSATAPIKTHIGGGDFSVSLKELFSYEQRVK